MNYLCLYLFYILKYGNSQHSAGDVSMPQVSPQAHRGMVIDAGSGGSRLHVFAWEPRIFETLPPPISFPTTEEHFTGKIKPGIASFANHPERVRDQLVVLIRFAKSVLKKEQDHWSDFPIYFKATGGMRELPLKQREAIMKCVRTFLSDKTLSPFYFRDDFARVISGEEEAVYAWSAANFLMGRLLPPLQGTGDAEPINSTYGTVDLGGSSCQIAFYVPGQDISEGLFKLHIGNQKHWNIYAKSFLQYGHVSARRRHLVAIADSATSSLGPDSSAVVPQALNYCFHAGYSENVLSSDGDVQVEIYGPAVPAGDQLDRCVAALQPLMRKSEGAFCNQVYNGECSIGGAYQPAIPNAYDSGFIGISSYIYAWSFLKMPATATLDQFRTRAREICSLSFSDVLLYYEGLNLLSGDISNIADYLPYYCFLSSYTLTLLETGFGFRHNQTLTVMDSVNGHTVGWALGAMLFEINDLPWDLVVSKQSSCMELIITCSIAALLLGIGLTYLYIRMRPSERTKDTRHVNEGSLRGDEQQQQQGVGGGQTTPLEIYQQSCNTLANDRDKTFNRNRVHSKEYISDRNPPEEFGRQQQQQAPCRSQQQHLSYNKQNSYILPNFFRFSMFRTSEYSPVPNEVKPNHNFQVV